MRYSDPNSDSWTAAFNQQASELQNLKLELKEATLDEKQYRQLLEIQKLSVSALRQQKVKLTLDAMSSKTSKKVNGIPS